MLINPTSCNHITSMQHITPENAMETKLCTKQIEV